MRLKSLGVAVVLLFGLAHLSAAQEKQEFKVTAVSGAYIHSAPNDQRETRIGSAVPYGTILRVSAANKNGWTEVVLPPSIKSARKTGFISSTVGELVGTAISSAKPTAPDPVQPRPTTAAPNPPPSAHVEPQTQTASAKPAAPTTSQDAAGTAGQFGVGASVAIPGAFGPMAIYDYNERISIEVEILLQKSAKGFDALGLYRFPQKTRSGKSWKLEPFLGGGIVFTQVDYVTFTRSYSSFLGEGGVFLSPVKYPNLRIIGAVVADFGNYGINGLNPISNYGVSFGAVYMFPK